MVAYRHHSDSSLSSVQPIEEGAQAEQSPNVQNSNHHKRSGTPSAHNLQGEDDKFPEYKEAPKFRGRRFLLLMSFAAGVVTLFLTSMMFNIPNDSSARLPMITLFILVSTAFYSPVSRSLAGVLISGGQFELMRESWIGSWCYTIHILREYSQYVGELDDVAE